MKLLIARNSEFPIRYISLSGPESSREVPDPRDAVRSGIVGDLADLETDVVEEASQDGRRRSMLQYLVDGPVVGPIRAWRRLRRENDQDN